jgi:integrase
LRLFILLCSDLAIRSGTAARIGPANYDPHRRTLQFTTKLGEKLTLPVTDEIAELIERTSPEDPASFVKQLHQREPQMKNHTLAGPHYALTIGAAFARLRLKLGITRKLTPHDFRRTTAVKLYEATGDARDVQALLGHRTLASTIWYLDHDLRPVSRETLELIKRPNWRKEHIA